MNIEFINMLKTDMATVHRVELNGDQYGMLILQTGELLFFQKNSRAFICEISAFDELINVQTIKKWDDGHIIEVDERKVIVETLIALYRNLYKGNLNVFK